VIDEVDFDLLTFLISPIQDDLKNLLSPFTDKKILNRSLFSLRRTYDDNIYKVKYWNYFIKNIDDIQGFLDSINRSDLVEDLKIKFKDMNPTTIIKTMLWKNGIKERDFIDFFSPITKEKFEISKCSYYYGSGSDYKSRDGKYYSGTVTINFSIIFDIYKNVIIKFLKENPNISYNNLLESLEKSSVLFTRFPPESHVL
jgi:hypothetical protein